jgi:hypothetical protein
MQRGNGAVIGKQNTPTTSVATGVWALNEVQRAVLNGTWPAAAVSDPYFENVTMLLPGNGTNGAQNNTFLDSSTNNFTITRNGNTTQGTFAPYGSNWSNYFDGSSFISTAYNSAFAINTYATFECWINFGALSSDRLIFGKDGFWLSYSYTGIGGSANKFGFGVFNGSAWTTVNSTTSPNVGQWYHIAGVRDNTTLRIYINGTQEATVSFASTPVVSSYSLCVGANTGTTSPITGYVSNARYCNGATSGALPYTANFIPPTAPLTATASTVFLSCQSNRFIDNSTNAFTLTVNGNTSVQRFSPFNPTAPYAAGTDGGSGYFDGSGDYLDLPTSFPSAAFTGNFTVEFWMYKTLASNQGDIIAWNRDGGTGACGIQINATQPGGVAFSVSTDGVNITQRGTGSTVAPANAWNHVAVVRSGSVITLYVNGVSQTTATVSGTLYNGSTTSYIGFGNFVYQGYLTGLRAVIGTAVYTANFTPPTTPPTAISGTQLLTNFTNGGIIDNAMMNDLETVGNAQISTSVSKFGGGSLAFDGSGDALRALTTPNLIYGSGDVTIEAWVYLNTIAGSPQVIVDTRASSAGSELLNFQFQSGVLYVYAGAYSLATELIAGTSAISATTWTHVAFVRSSGTNRLFVNGIQQSSNTNAWTQVLNSGTLTSVGMVATSTANPMNGYIDDLRITKGIARYVQNFTPPTQAFQTS